MNCCGDIFSRFMFGDMRASNPPESKGVYIIRVKGKGKPVKQVIEDAMECIRQLNWPLVGKKMSNRIERLQRLSVCSVVYIGSAGTGAESKHTLLGRYEDFAGRHTAMYPIWALLYSGWELEYGWVQSSKPKILEGQLKSRYKELHKGELPALVRR